MIPILISESKHESFVGSLSVFGLYECFIEWPDLGQKESLMKGFVEVSIRKDIRISNFVVCCGMFGDLRPNCEYFSFY